MRLAVLTSGGDAPGMNACVRAVVRSALARSMEVYGIRRGFEGIFTEAFEPMDAASIVNIVHRGGTMLGTSRCPRMQTPEGMAEAVAVLDRHRIDALILIGGDGTFRGGAALEAAGGPATIGIPGTIDNDVAGSDRSIGFDTAVNTAVDALDKIRDTATSHEVLHFVEVMGRHCGAIALSAGLAGGAEATLVPEVDLSDEALAERIRIKIAQGKRSVIVVVAEGAGQDGAGPTAERVGALLGLDYRLTVLGHIQRGGSPTASDRILGAVMGVEAVTAVADGRRGAFIGIRHGDVVLVPYAESGDLRAPLDERLLAVTTLLG